MEIRQGRPEGLDYLGQLIADGDLLIEGQANRRQTPGEIGRMGIHLSAQ
jgi:hypothetical protein